MQSVLLGKSFDDVVLSDFGTALAFKGRDRSLTGGFNQTIASILEIFRQGTRLYMAPEMLKGKSYDMAVDIYSLSITIWEIIHRRY